MAGNRTQYGVRKDGGSGGAVDSVNGDTGVVTVNLDSVLAQTTALADGVFAISVVGGVATAVPIEGETVGSYKAFATTAIPSNYLWCNGAIVNIATYPDLFSVIGDTYGGDGVTTFGLPDLQGRFLKGDDGNNIGTSDGANTLSTSQLPVSNVSGTISVSQNNGDIPATNNAFFANGVADGGGENILGFIANGSEGVTVSVAGVNVSFGNDDEHEHPHLVARWAICFEAVGYATSSGADNIYNSDGQLNSDRNVQMETFSLNFRNSDNPNPTTSFTIQINDSDLSGDYNSNTFQLNAGDGVYFLRKNRLLAGDDNSIQFGIRDNVAFGITPNYGDFKALFGTILNDIVSSFVGFRMKYLEGLFYQDSQTKTGIKYIDFGEIDPTDSTNTADFSTLEWNSLAPKKYIDNNVITPDREQTHASGASIIVNDTTSILYVDPASTIASLTIILPENPVNGQEVKVSFGGTIALGVVCTVLAVTGNTGHTVLGGVGIADADAGDGYIFKFQSSSNLWRIFS